MSRANPLWDAPRITSELSKLGIKVSRAAQGPEFGQVVELPMVGGLHHRYEREVA